MHTSLPQVGVIRPYKGINDFSTQAYTTGFSFFIAIRRQLCTSTHSDVMIKLMCKMYIVCCRCIKVLDVMVYLTLGSSSWKGLPCPVVRDGRI